MLTPTKLNREEESIIIDVCGELFRTYRVSGISLPKIPTLLMGLTNPALLISTLDAKFLWNRYLNDILTRIKEHKKLEEMAYRNFFVAYKESMFNKAIFGTKVSKFEKQSEEYIKLLAAGLNSCFYRDIRETENDFIMIIEQ